MRLLHLMGLLDLQSAKPDLAAAQTYLVRSSELARVLNALPNLAQIELSFAELWTKTGDLERATKAFDSAERISVQIGHRGLADDVARGRAQLAGLDVPQPSWR